MAAGGEAGEQLDWVETTGRSIEEAKRAALEQLGVEEKDAEFEVLAEPRLGLFGRLKEEARVRARLLPHYPRSKGDRRDRKRGRSSAVLTGNVRPAKEPPAQEAAQLPTQGAPDAQAGRPTTTRKRRRGRKARSNAPEASSPTTSPMSATSTGQASLGQMSEEELGEQVKLAENFLVGLLERLGARASVDARSREDGFIEVNLNGEDLGFLIGPRGVTLLALQELTRTVVQRRAPTQESKVLVDINGYRRRRHEALARFAKQIAREVAATQVKRALEPMPPSDRKVVHDAVHDVPGVTTLSEGEEPNRRVVLVPVPQEAPVEGEGTMPGATAKSQDALTNTKHTEAGEDAAEDSSGQRVPS